jgi:hypothetical protein
LRKPKASSHPHGLKVAAKAKSITFKPEPAAKITTKKFATSKKKIAA